MTQDMDFDRKTAEELARRYDSFYLYDEKRIAARVSRLKEHFPNVRFLYSVKCNPNPHVIRSIFSRGFGADAASIGEVKLAAACGLTAGEIYYSAPGKSAWEIEEALDCAVLIADSISEVERIQQAAARKGITAEIGLRINPDFSFGGGNGLPSKFGIDEEQAMAFLEKGGCPNVKITGLHVHLRSQELKAETIAEYYQNILRLAERIQQVNPCRLAFLNMGSGMGVQYSQKEEPLDIGGLANMAGQALNRFAEQFPDTEIMIETGRYVVSEAGVYITKVADRKVSRGKTYIILKNTLNGCIRPSLARLIARYAKGPVQEGCEPLFSGTDAFRFIALKGGETEERVQLVGNLCTGADVIAEDIMMPRLQCGDAVVVTNAGAYAAVLSPMQFSSQERAAELFLDEKGDVTE